MKTGWETEEFTPGLKAGAWESSAVMPTHTEFRHCVKSVKIRRKSLAYRDVVLQMVCKRCFHVDSGMGVRVDYCRAIQPERVS